MKVVMVTIMKAVMTMTMAINSVVMVMFVESMYSNNSKVYLSFPMVAGLLSFR